MICPWPRPRRPGGGPGPDVIMVPTTRYPAGIPLLAAGRLVRTRFLARLRCGFLRTGPGAARAWFFSEAEVALDRVQPLGDRVQPITDRGQRAQDPFQRRGAGAATLSGSRISPSRRCSVPM